jgi:ribosomal protein S18 acetylase RimI-like enzyme
MARTLEDGVMCMIYDVGVHPDYQRQGIGRHILLDLEEELSPRNYASIGLFAWENNPANAPFYESLGFVRTSGMEWTKHMRPE